MKFRRRKKVRAVPFIPSLITLLNAFFGFMAITATSKGEFVTASWYIVASVFIDGFDGKIARALNATSFFGKELDSLCDLVSFGVAPSYMIYSYLKGGVVEAISDQLLLIFSFFFLASAAIRLARYNVETTGNMGFFSGLPSPAAAGFIASVIIAIRWYDKALNTDFFANATIFFLPYISLIISLLMVSRAKYPHVMNTLISKRVSIKSFAVVILTLLMVIVFKEFALFLIGLLYVTVTPFLRRKIRSFPKTHVIDSNRAQ